LLPYCTWNFNTGECDRIDKNKYHLKEVRIWFGDVEISKVLNQIIYGYQKYNGAVEITNPSIDSTCYDIKAE